jgi:hypothetical protein
MYVVTKALRLLALIFLFILYSCGGGGGGGAGGGGNSGPSISFSASDLTFFANDPTAATPASQTIIATISGQISGTLYVKIIGTGAAIGSISNFVITSATTGQASVSVPTPSSLGAGTYTGVITVYACTTDPNCNGSQLAGSPKTINVSYKVAGITAAPAYVNYFAGAGQTPAPQNLTLTSNMGTQAWTSSVTYDSGTSGWLRVPASGASLPATIATSATSKPAGVYRAHVTFTSNGSTIVVPVALNVNPMGANFVSPYLATANISNDVIIRGWGFSGATQVLFGATPASAFSVVSDTEIHATYPALAAGTYPVTVNALSTRANLVVVNAPAFAYATIARTANAKELHNLIYDAEKRAIYLLDSDWVASTERVERYRFTGTSWVSDTPISFGSPIDLNSRIALTPDGSEILKTDYSSMKHISTASFTTTASVSAIPDLGIPTLNTFSMANDGSVIGNASNQVAWEGYYKYDILNRAFFKISTPAGFTNPINRNSMAGSADGSRLLIAPFPSYSTPNPGNWYYYKSSDSTFVATTLSTPNFFGEPSTVSTSLNGSRSIIQNVVYDASFNVLGTLLPSWGLVDRVVISPDGTKAYTYIKSTGVIHKYDLTSINGSGEFAEIGTGTLVTDSPGDGISMAISPDGGNLFIVGKALVITMAAP